MTKIVDVPLLSSFASSTYINLQANGQSVTNATNPNGIDTALYIGDGYMVSTILGTDLPIFGNIRSELSFTQATQAVGEYFYVWECYIPDPWGPTNYALIAQIHDTPDGGDGAKFPNLTIGLHNGNMIGRLPVSGNLPGTESTSYREVFRIRYQTDHWYQFCVHVNWQTDSTGAIEILVDKVPLFREYGKPTMYTDALAPYFKIGAYNGEGYAFSSATVFYRNVAIWQGRESYTNVIGDLPQSPLRIISV